MSEGAAAPPRPAIPPAFWALVALVACERVALRLAPDPVTLARATGIIGALVAGAMGLLARTPARAVVPLLAVLSCALAAGALACSLELARQESVGRALASGSVSSWELRVAGDLSEGASGWQGRAEVLMDGGRAGSVWLRAPEELAFGSTITCVGRFSANGEDAWGVSSRMQGLAGSVRVVRVLSRRPRGGPLGALEELRGAVLASFNAPSSDARALLAGSVCGSSAALRSRGLDDTFATCGVAHLVAVSGGHLVLVCALARSLLSHTSLDPGARAGALLVVSALFVAFCGAPVSAVRSWAMALVASAAELVGRRAHPLSSASAVGIALALVDPGVSGQLGYLLSVTCVCGICLFGAYARFLVRLLVGRARPPRAISPPASAALARASADAVDALALTLVSQAVTLPLTCAVFAQLSLVAPLANVLLAPLFSALLALGLVAACLVGAPLAQGVALACCDVVGRAFVWLLRALASLPLASVPVEVEEGPALALLAGASVLLLIWWPRPSRRALAGLTGIAASCALAWFLRWRLLAPACVRVLDVGQGDAILVTDGAHAALVDTGPDASVVEALARAHVYHLDAVLLTHLHDDHVGGLDDLLAVVGVDQLVVAEGVGGSTGAWDLSVSEVGYGDALVIGGFRLRIVSPTGPVDGTHNADSVELALSFDDGTRSLTALLTGDAEKDETGAALARCDVGDIDLLKVGHHGSEVSLTQEQARALDAEVAVASAGEGNSYGHPDPVCVETLERAGSLFLCTKDVGDVCVEPGAEGPRVSCEREAPGEVLPW